MSARLSRASGVLGYSNETAIVDGDAGVVDREQHSVGGASYTVELVRDPKPALFEFDHPTGLDRSFGRDKAAQFPTWETPLSSVGGALLSNGRVRLACVDITTQQLLIRPAHNYAGLLQWQLSDGLVSVSVALWWPWLVTLTVLAILAVVFLAVAG